MKVKDIVKNEETELSRDELISKMKEGRQVDLILKAYFFPDEAEAVQLS